MNRLRTLLSSLAVAATVATALPSTASGIPQVSPKAPSIVIQAAADCRAIGRQKAAEKGGTLLSARRANRGGRSVCVIVVSVPSNDGKPPRRDEDVVSAD